MVVPQTQRPALSGTALKRLALCSMLLDHLGASCLEAGVFSRPGPISEPLLTLDLCLRWAGRLAFPLYCFLLVEGFLHTHSLRQYAGRMLAFALVSELPFDLAFFHTLIYRGHQNVYWTLFFGLCALGCLRHCGEQSAPGIFSALALAVLAELLRTDYGAIGVLLIVVLYITRPPGPCSACSGPWPSAMSCPRRWRSCPSLFIMVSGAAAPGPSNGRFTSFTPPTWPCWPP